MGTLLEPPARHFKAMVYMKPSEVLSPVRLETYSCLVVPGQARR